MSQTHAVLYFETAYGEYGGHLKLPGAVLWIPAESACYSYTFGRTSFSFFSSRRRHTRLQGDWSSDVCSSDLRNQATPTAKDISDATSRDNQRGERQHVAVESPLKIVQICVQILSQCNQRDVDRRDRKSVV